MSGRRALLQCTVLSLQDSCVFYPRCVGCYSRIEAEEHNNFRYRCSRCGYRCEKEQVQFRYRLSLKVTRDRSIFGVTVFGNSLNQFFGLNASELQKLVGVKSSRSVLLTKAVKDCFIGRRFIFGIKLDSRGNESSFEGLLTNNFNFRETSQFVASQMILPKNTHLTGFTVLNYYQNLLLKASELDLDCSQPNRIQAPTLVLIPTQSPTSSFGNSTLFKSGVISQALRRSKHQGDSFSSTPPWQQSPGLVTSSAEQENEDENNRLEESKESSFLADRDTLKSHASPLVSHLSLPLELSIHESPSFGKFSKSCTRNIGSSFSKHTWSSPSQPGQKSHEHSGTFSSGSLIWENLPFSESLSEFLCEEDKKDNEEIRKKLDVDHQKKNPTFVENPKLEGGSTSVSQRASNNSQGLLDITNALPACGDEDLPDYEDETPVKHRNKRESRKTISSKQNKEADRTSLCLEGHEDELYNCSADLFGDSPMCTENLTLNAERSKVVKNIDTSFSKLDCDQIDPYRNVRHVTPKQEAEKTQETNNIEFVPPSQSTPVVKVHVTQLASFKNALGSIKEKRIHNMTPIRQSHRAALGRKSSKTEEHLKAGWHQTKLHKRNFNKELDETMNPKNDSQTSVCFLEEDEEIIAPTPAGKAELSTAVRRKRHADLFQDTFWIGCQEDRAGFKRTIVDQTFTSQKDPIQKEEFGNETVFEDVSKRSNVYLWDSKNQTCDWSKDLFSDSI